MESFRAKENHAEGRSVLPADGALVTVSPWRRMVVWICGALLTALALFYPVRGILAGEPSESLLAVPWGFFALICIRAALAGIILSSKGIKARGMFRTYHWQWEEIERFELLERAPRPRLRVHLRNGKSHRFAGFEAQTSAQEARLHKIVRALEERLETEHGRSLV